MEDSTLQSTGQAFIRLGRLLDDMTKQKKQYRQIAVASGSDPFDAEFNTHFELLELLEGIADNWTDRESEAEFLKLHKWTQTEIAESLQINQSAVRWTAVDVLLNRWRDAAVQMLKTD